VAGTARRPDATSAAADVPVQAAIPAWVRAAGTSEPERATPVRRAIARRRWVAMTTPCAVPATRGSHASRSNAEMPAVNPWALTVAVAEVAVVGGWVEAAVAARKHG
jgi:hypothetical protein